MKRRLTVVLAVVFVVIPLLASIPPVAGWVDPGPYPVEESLQMSNYAWGSLYCGPESGVSIGRYYRDEHQPQYSNLPNGNDYEDMFDRLCDYMDTYGGGYTYRSAYGPGFVEMALHYGYDNFSYVRDSSVTNDDFWDIVNAIDHGWPVALAGDFEDVPAISGGEPLWPPTAGHFIAIKGYYYYIAYWAGPGTPITINHRIYCTDSYSEENHLVLDWNTVVANADPDIIIIKDEDSEVDGLVEGFEWGSDGDRLIYWQELGGEVDWYGNSRVEIDNAQKHTGAVSARFYRSYWRSPYAYYDLNEPYYIGFWLKHDDTVYPEFRNGNGSYAIRVRVGAQRRIEYYNGTWHSLPWSLQSKWNRIEFKNISWSGHTFDIYVDGYLWKTGATMWHYSGYNGRLYFRSSTGSGTFWIDDITDSLRPL